MGTSADVFDCVGEEQFPGGGDCSELRLDVTDGDTLFFAVDSLAGESGDYYINVFCDDTPI